MVFRYESEHFFKGNALKTRWASWLLILLIALQSVAVAADAHEFGQSPSDEAVAHSAAGGTFDEADSASEPGDSSATHQHCPHCCHCSWHALASFPIAQTLRTPGSLPPYYIAFHSQHSSAFFRPPKAA